MAKSPGYRCSACDATFLQWAGKCESCGEWNTLQQQVSVSAKGRRSSGRSGASFATVSVNEAVRQVAQQPRISTGDLEVDRVLGGGLVPGMAVLFAGEPGIGKSTLLLQIAHAIARHHTVLYVSAEESTAQIGLRAQRLGVDGASSSLVIAHTTQATDVAEHIRLHKPTLCVVDSMQTLLVPEVQSEAGNVSQVKAVSHVLVDAAKHSGTVLILVGHVTKGGSLAGPKVVEHLVDTVLRLEGDKTHSFRLLRPIKHRFGSTQETGVFEMQGHGMMPVANPSERLLGERLVHAPGSAVTPLVDGSSVFLVEVQAIAVRSSYGYPKRTASGCDLNRLNVLLAVLERRAGVATSDLDVYANVVGGLQAKEPGVDLALAVAVASSVADRALPEAVAVLGEVGLTGEVRRVSHMGQRIKEAIQYGCTTIIAPRGAKSDWKASCTNASSKGKKSGTGDAPRDRNERAPSVQIHEVTTLRGALTALSLAGKASAARSAVSLAVSRSKAA